MGSPLTAAFALANAFNPANFDLLHEYPHTVRSRVCVYELALGQPLAIVSIYRTVGPFDSQQ